MDLSSRFLLGADLLAGVLESVGPCFDPQWAVGLNGSGPCLCRAERVAATAVNRFEKLFQLKTLLILAFIELHFSNGKSKIFS